MKYIKYIVTILLVVTGVFISVTFYQFEITGISTEASADFVNLTKEEIVERWNRIADINEKENLKYFIIDNVESDEKDTYITLYSDEDIRDEFISLGYYACDFATLTGKKIHFRYGTWEEYLNRTTVTPTNTIFYENYDESQVSNKNLKEEVQQTGYDSRISIRTVLLCLWGGIFTVILFFTIWDAYCSQKEWILKLYYGWPYHGLLVRKLGTNMVLSVLIVGGLLLLLGKYNILAIAQDALVVPLVVFLAAECIIYSFAMARIDYKAVLGKIDGSGKLLALSYILGGASLCLLIVVCNFLCGQFQILYPIIEQKDFYEVFQGAYHVSLIMDDTSETNENGVSIGMPLSETIVEDIYEKKIDDWNICRWWYIRDTSDGLNLELEAPLICANKNAEFLIRKYLPEYEEYTFLPDTQYILIPESDRQEYMKNESQIMEYLLGNLSMEEYDSESGHLEVLYYQKDIVTYAFFSTGDDGLSDIQRCVNPIIGFDTTSTPMFDDSFGNCILNVMAISTAPDNFISEIETNYPVTDVNYEDIYANYQKRLTTKLQNFMALIVIFVLAVIAELIITGMIIRNEHDMNALEICIRKVNGAPLHQRYAQMFNMMLIASITGFIVSEIVIYIQSQQFSILVIPIGLCCVLAEVTIFSLQALKWEKKSINKILKGGAL